MKRSKIAVRSRTSAFLAGFLRVTLTAVIVVLGVDIYLLAGNAPASSLLGQLLGKRPCDQPIHYDVGPFDARFGISKQTFQDAIAKAADIWGKAEGRPVFVYDPDHATLPVGLVYDYRQEDVTRLKALGLTLTDDRASYDALKKKYDALVAQADALNASLDAEVAAHNAKVAALETEIADWNARGGAPKRVYAQIVAEQDALDAEGQKIAADEAHVNSVIADANAVATELNKVAKTLNLEGVAYTKTGAPLAQGFEEGLYEANATGTSITIFEFDSQANLVRVLAHEFGHALGMGHVSDTKAIMYPINSGGSETPTAADLQELKNACGGR